MEDDDARMHVRNLSAHRTSNEEEALNLVSFHIACALVLSWACTCMPCLVRLCLEPLLLHA